MDNTIPIDITPDDAGKISALIDQCLKVIKESNERSVKIYAEIERDRSEREKIIQEVRRMLNVEKSL